MMVALEIVLKTKENARLVASFRDDAEAKRMSLHQKPKTEDEFYKQFCGYYLLKDLSPLFASVEGRKIAFIALHNDLGFLTSCT